MKKSTIAIVKKEAKEKGIHPMKHWLEQKEVETEADFYRGKVYLNDANYFMENLFGLFVSTEEEYTIMETSGMGYEIQMGWSLIHLFYSREEAVEWRNENIKRRLLKTLFDGSEIWNYGGMFEECPKKIRR